jgi:hypothetical protein
MKQMGFAAVVALSLGISAVAAAAQVASAPAQQTGDDKKDVTITGCVVKGDGGYVLSNVAEQTAAAAVAGGLPSAPQPAGAVMPGRVLYWLDDDDDLAEHAGHKVEVEGELKGDIERGQISAEREGGLIELEFKVDGDKKVTIKVPNVPPTVGTSGTVGDKETDIPYIVRKIDVDKVKMISSTCQ